MIWIIFIILLLIIFPIYIEINLHLESEKNIYYQFSLYSLLPLFFGKVTFDNSEIILYGNLIKIKKIKYKQLFNFKNKIKPLQDYHLIHFNTLIEFGNNDNPLMPISVAFILQNVFNVSKSILTANKPYFILNNQYNIYSDRNLFNFYVNTGCIFNLLMLILSVIKILMEKIINEFRKKQQN